ncbi:hypothetical protein WAI453_003457 [Rhynchosporium graminicola]
MPGRVAIPSSHILSSVWFRRQQSSRMRTKLQHGGTRHKEYRKRNSPPVRRYYLHIRSRGLDNGTPSCTYRLARYRNSSEAVLPFGHRVARSLLRRVLEESEGTSSPRSNRPCLNSPPTVIITQPFRRITHRTSYLPTTQKARPWNNCHRYPVTFDRYRIFPVKLITRHFETIDNTGEAAAS